MRPTDSTAPTPTGTEVSELHHHALDNLRYIRETMESAGSFTAVSGWGMVLIGATALVAAWIASTTIGTAPWLWTWGVEGALAIAVGGATMGLKAREAHQPLLSGPGKKFVLSFLPAAFVGALLTTFLVRAGTVSALPGIWMSLYGMAVVAGGMYSVRAVPVLGTAFLTLGGVALFAPVAWGNVLMAIGFGGLHVVFGIVITRRHGG